LAATDENPDMSCWVVPSVAAEFWGVSLDAVWARIYAGQVPHKRDGGFVFVDVAPWSADLHGVYQHEPPQTFIAEQDAPLDPQEIALLAGSVVGFEEPREAKDEDIDEEELPLLEEEGPASVSRFTWQEMRRRVGRTRIPPKAA
jgi:hypothetical protein